MDATVSNESKREHQMSALVSDIDSHVSHLDAMLFMAYYGTGEGGDVPLSRMPIADQENYLSACCEKIRCIRLAWEQLTDLLTGAAASEGKVEGRALQR